MPTLDQERANFAWTWTNPATLSDSFLRIAQGAPSLIMSNGLMQTIAFYKQKDDANDVLQAVLEWVGGQIFGLPREACSFDGVMQRLVGGDADTYFRATEEALAILKWIRQFAKARHEAFRVRNDQPEGQR